MKTKSFISLCLGLMLMIPSYVSAQSSEKADFFRTVIANQSSSIYDFLVCGFNSKNTEFRSCSAYMSHEGVQRDCKELGLDITTTYSKIKKAWDIFLQVENTDLEEFGKYMIDYDPNNIYAPKCPNPELKRKLKTVPLKIK